jgi:hypothetical protein
MSKLYSSFVITLFFMVGPYISHAQEVSADAAALTTATELPSQNMSDTESSSGEAFHAFTGKITGNNVRLRLQPNLEGFIVRELYRGYHIVIEDEENGFYVVKAPADIKAFVYRTFVLDGIIEGSRVNVRLGPSLDDPVIMQFNSGDKVTGVISPLNTKWLEIDIPADTTFYVAREYVEYAGPPSFLAQYEERRKELSNLINAAYFSAQAEMKKDFSVIDFDKIITSFQNILTDYKDFPHNVEQAQEMLEGFHDTFLQKKISFLEMKTNTSSEQWASKSSELSQQIASYEERLSDLTSGKTISSTSMSNTSQKKEIYSSEKTKEEAPLSISTQEITTLELPDFAYEDSSSITLNEAMRSWMPREESFFKTWVLGNPTKTKRDFSIEETLSSTMLTGILEPYSRFVRNKPGDFILKDSNGVTIAYLYSTKVDLQEKTNTEITVKANIRENNDFAFPAFHVQSIE